MKKTLLFLTSMLLMLTLAAPNAKAQEWSTGIDIYSSYIWRGSKFGNGPAFQPSVEFNTGGFSIGGWGSISSGTDEGLEMDLYAGYTFDLNENSTLGFTLTDYYFGGDWTDFKYVHNLEPSITLELGDFSLMGAYMFLKGTEETPTVKGQDFAEDGDVYFEAGYSFKAVSLTLGAGDGQYTDDGDFNVCNISVGTSKDVKITDTYTLPVSGAVVLNPSTGGFFITVGVTLF